MSEKIHVRVFFKDGVMGDGIGFLRRAISRAIQLHVMLDEHMFIRMPRPLAVIARATIEDDTRYEYRTYYIPILAETIDKLLECIGNSLEKLLNPKPSRYVDASIIIKWNNDEHSGFTFIRGPMAPNAKSGHVEIITMR